MTSCHFRWRLPLTSGQKWIVGSWNRKSRDLRWETADKCEKRIVGSCNRKSRDLRWETADECEKRIVGSRWGKTAEKTRAQSPKSNLGKEGWSLKTTRNKKIIFFIKLVFTRTEKCFWRWETADECEKRIVGSRWGKTAEKTRAQSPKSNLGKEGWSLKTTRNKKIIFFIKLVFTRTEKCFWSVP